VLPRLLCGGGFGGGVAGGGGFRRRPPATPNPSPFHAFLRFCDWLYVRTGRTDGIALVRLMELVFEYLTVELKLDAGRAAAALWNDYRRSGHHDKPLFLKNFLPAETAAPPPAKPHPVLPRRQARRLG